MAPQVEAVRCVRFVNKSVQRSLVSALCVLSILLIPSCRTDGENDNTSPQAVPSPIVQDEGIAPLGDISAERMLSNLRELSSIEAWSGWRLAATQGEQEARDFIGDQLGTFEFLIENGLEVKQEPFDVFLSTEIWEAALFISLEGNPIEVPTNVVVRTNNDVAGALLQDTDGGLNDLQHDPVTVSGRVFLIQTPEELNALTLQDAQGSSLWVDYALVDPVIRTGGDAVENFDRLVAANPTSIVLVTENSERNWQSHGTFSTAGGVLDNSERNEQLAVLQVSLEDLKNQGIDSWSGLQKVENAAILLDIDVLSPASSANLVAFIPGTEPSAATILGAHIDSANTPGALDDGSGCVILLEIAEVLNHAEVLPTHDLYLVWFGSEELGLLGSAAFADSHQALLDQKTRMLQVDQVSSPLAGASAGLFLHTWPPDNLEWAQAIQQLGQSIEVSTQVASTPVSSDNTSFTGYGVPQANLIYTVEAPPPVFGGPWYANHIHDPYDDLPLVTQQADVLMQMAKVALLAALSHYGGSAEAISPPDRRVVFLDWSEGVDHLTPAKLPDAGAAFNRAGLNVDLLEYGAQTTISDLADTTALIVVPPTLPEGSAGDSARLAGLINLIEDYVTSGGFLVLANSVQTLGLFNRPLGLNRGAKDFNALADTFGIRFEEDGIQRVSCEIQSSNTLVEGLQDLHLVFGNGLPIRVEHGEVLAACGDQPIAVIMEYGTQGGEILVLADVGILGSTFDGGANPQFLDNLSRQIAGAGSLRR